MKSRLTNALLGCLLAAFQTAATAQDSRIVEWVEQAPASDKFSIALGYPVPLPVDTPLPFDGYRSYTALHFRHQDLALTTPWVHPFTVGTTRSGRPIWAYRLGDADTRSAYGKPEQAMLTNGGIHAREWQSPEVATGIIERIALTDDEPLIAYLRDNANIVVIPVLNVDGFLQTQRFPEKNWLGTDPGSPEYSPRDGRMRRKNMLAVDEELDSQSDHLLGVDLNRNNPPFWATNPQRSSANVASLVHHGAAAQSEPETRALVAAVELGPADRLSMYTDLHSFSQVHFWVRNGNLRLAAQTERLLGTFSRFHRNFPAGKDYLYARASNVPGNRGIGATDEFFTHQYQVPSWTLEIEPSDGTSAHAPLPGGGADYGGLGRNGHDGFILPESEIGRVRSDLAETFAIAYYRQSGPPAITAMRIVDSATGATVLEAEWDPAGDDRRQLHRFQAQDLQLDRPYRLWVAWDKPMRWRSNGAVAALPGQHDSTLGVEREATLRADKPERPPLTLITENERWLDAGGGSPDGYFRYRDDALAADILFPADANNLELVQGTVSAALEHLVFDMTGLAGDADPATVARWENGGWAGYEDSGGKDLTDFGGADATIEAAISDGALGDPFVIEAGTSSAWFDPQRDGEGFLLEILTGGRALMYWFTYDAQGRQDWYVAQGEIQGPRGDGRGNRILFPELMRVSGGEFGPGFDPDKVTRTVVGSASFIWSSCDSGAMKWALDAEGQPPRQGRMQLQRLSRVMGIDCENASLPPALEAGRLSGSWYDPTHSGEGYVLEVLTDQRVLVYWFSFDAVGARRWFYGSGAIVGDVLAFETLYTTSGGKFGAAFDPAAVAVEPWGSLELELSCEVGIARFEPRENGFPAGILELQRLTFLAGLDCGD